MPIGTFDCFIIASLIVRSSPPVERSITASAPASMAAFNFSSSLSMEHESWEEPILALTFTLVFFPIAVGLQPAWFIFLGMTTSPDATSLISSFTSMFSDFAASLISCVTIPFFAISSCVIYISLESIIDFMARVRPQTSPAEKIAEINEKFFIPIFFKSFIL